MLYILEETDEYILKVASSLAVVIVKIQCNVGFRKNENV